MPGGDRSGPAGWGPMSGRGAGFCGGYGMPGYVRAGRGRGFGMGFGRGGRGAGFGGFRWHNCFSGPWMPPANRFGAYAQPDPESEKHQLKQQADALASELEMIRKRLDELESSD